MQRNTAVKAVCYCSVCDEAFRSPRAPAKCPNGCRTIGGVLPSEPNYCIDLRAPHRGALSNTIARSRVCSCYGQRPHHDPGR